MQSPLCQAIALGEFSPWAKQILNEWQSEGLINLSYEASVAHFVQKHARPDQSHIAIVENSNTSKQIITQIRTSEHPVLILWVGKSFSKEDFAFALGNRIYATIENPALADKNAQSVFSRADSARTKKDQLKHLFQSLKTLLLQTEPDSKNKSLFAELKAAVGKMERLTDANELFNLEIRKEAGSQSTLPLHKSQGLGDALLTIAELERTGTLWVRGAKPEEEGKIDFIQGQITVAEAGAVTQLKAIYRMFLWDSPRFLFNRKNPEDCEAREIINRDIEALVKEGEEHQLRFQTLKKELPPTNLKLDIEASSMNTSIALSPLDFSTLTDVVAFKFVTDILDYSKNWDVDLFEGLIRLKKSGMIKILPASPVAV